jgi:hypothetical protein
METTSIDETDGNPFLLWDEMQLSFWDASMELILAMWCDIAPSSFRYFRRISLDNKTRALFSCSFLSPLCVHSIWWIGVSYVRGVKLDVHGPVGSARPWIWTCITFSRSRMRPLTGYVTPYPLISDLFKNGNSLAVVTEIIHRCLFGWRYHLLNQLYPFKCDPNAQKINKRPKS